MPDHEERLDPLLRLPINLRIVLMEKLEKALESGPLMGFPLINFDIYVTDGLWSRSMTNAVAI